MNFQKQLVLFESYIEEREGEYPQLDQQMKYLFPTLVNNIVGKLQMTFPILAPVQKKESSLMMSKIKGIDIEVRLNSMSARNAYTFPAISRAGLVSIPGFGGLYSIYKAVQFLESYQDKLKKVKINSKDKTVEFSSFFRQNKIKFLVFTTKGTLTDLEPEERVALILHEIGHWATIDLTLVSKIAAVSRVIPALGLIGLILSLLYSRKAEWMSDKFANTAGYGQKLADALRKITGSVRPLKKVSFITVLNDILLKIIYIMINIIDPIIPISKHPAPESRAKQLEGEQISMIMDKIKPMTLKIDKVLAAAFKKTK